MCGVCMCVPVVCVWGEGVCVRVCVYGGGALINSLYYNYIQELEEGDTVQILFQAVRFAPLEYIIIAKKCRVIDTN